MIAYRIRIFVVLTLNQQGGRAVGYFSGPATVSNSVRETMKTVKCWEIR